MVMRSTSIIFAILAALVACSLAAPVLDRRARQATASDLLNTMRTGLKVLSKQSRFRLAQSLGVNCSCIESSTAGSCVVLRSALKTTCKLYDANQILPNASLPDQTSQQVLEIMSEKTLQDACKWTNETLQSVGSSGLPASVHCSNVSTLSDMCGEWNDLVSIKTIESKVDTLGPQAITEEAWLDKHTEINRNSANFYFGQGC